MKEHWRILIVPVVALGLVAGLVAIKGRARSLPVSSSLASPDAEEPASPEKPRFGPAPCTLQSAALLSSAGEVGGVPDVAEKAAQEPREKLIEEELAEAGENHEAVYYMSRIREAVAEGNPGFARDLLGQMRELHSESVLLGIAEDLIEKPENKEEAR